MPPDPRPLKPAALAPTTVVPDAVNLAQVKRVLVVKLRHHGDVLLASPVFRVLKEHAPHVEIDALVYSDTREMLAGHPAISQIHVVDRGWKKLGFAGQARREGELFNALKARRYQLLVHLTDHWRGAWLSLLLGPRWSVAPARVGRFWGRCFTHRYPFPKARPRHTVELNLDALRRLGVQPTEAQKPLWLVPGPEAEARVDGLLAEHGLGPGGFIHVHPTSRWLFKAWTEERNAELLRRLAADGHRLVLTAAPDPRERAIAARILAAAGPGVVDLSGQLTLRELAALTARARLFFGVDSAPMHIAAAMGTPVVALFGPSGEIEWGPWRVPHRVVTSGHPCRPCGNDGCGGGKVSECLTQLPVERVQAAIHELLAGA